MSNVWSVTVGLMFVLLGSGVLPGAERPNLMVVLTDDLGYGDLACYGSETVLTPNLDKFAAEGLKLTNCYAAAANCSPARTGLILFARGAARRVWRARRPPDRPALCGASGAASTLIWHFLFPAELQSCLPACPGPMPKNLRCR